MTSSLSRAASAQDIPAAGIGEKLDWDAFSALYFPGRGRHHLDAVAAYGAYRQGRDWRATPTKLTLVPNEPASAALEADSGEAAVDRLLVAVAAERVWEKQDGLSS
jgi:hypothetical protein